MRQFLTFRVYSHLFQLLCVVNLGSSMSSRLLKPESVAAKARKRQRDTETTLDYDSVKYLSSETPVVKKMAGMEIYIDRMTTTRASRGSSDLEKSKNRKKRTLEGGMRREAYGTGVKVEREIKRDIEKVAVGSRVRVSEGVHSSARTAQHAGKGGIVVNMARAWIAVKIDGESEHNPISFRPKDLTTSVLSHSDPNTVFSSHMELSASPPIKMPHNGGARAASKKEILPSTLININKIKVAPTPNFGACTGIEQGVFCLSPAPVSMNISDTLEVHNGVAHGSSTPKEPREQILMTVAYPASASVGNISFQARERALTQHM